MRCWVPQVVELFLDVNCVSKSMQNKIFKYEARSAAHSLPSWHWYSCTHAQQPAFLELKICCGLSVSSPALCSDLLAQVLL